MSILVPGEIPKIIKKRSILVAEENPKIDLKSKKTPPVKGQRRSVAGWFCFLLFNIFRHILSM